MGYCFLYKRFGGSGGGSGHSGMVKTVLGKILSLSDSANDSLKGLRIFGKTTQNSTPTPEVPVPLESVGSDGDVIVTMCGKNLIALKDYKTASDFITRETKNGVLKVTCVSQGGDLLTVLVSAFINASFDGTNNFPAGNYTYNGVAEIVQSGVSSYESTRVHLILADGTSTTIDNGTTKVIAQSFSVEKITFMSGTMNLRRDNTVTLLPILESGSGTVQTLTAQTPNGLPGIPVTSGGNYTDENGQQWVCDEVDFASGKYVQRIRVLDFETMDWSYNTGIAAWVSSENVTDMKNDALICETLPKFLIMGNDRELGAKANPPYSVWARNGSDVITPTGKAIGLLAEAVETSLPTEELAQYAALHTNYPNTTVFNDGGAGMEVKYVSTGG